ncbi:DUF6683 family protein [Coralloluteibacterium stylophorae]|uniref:Uncharacterized protein n=1 Tax=Coralloluteibacterium stylophorae TaxID=1776034 RepID=A0AAP2G278_9GAMM|nr:DUF6683 family protein [Coralloluteibacterium stylophorae]MBS7458790.1 hypothetical protein [Coralloluteibacterium stylophorae]
MRPAGNRRARAARPRRAASTRIAWLLAMVLAALAGPVASQDAARSAFRAAIGTALSGGAAADAAPSPADLRFARDPALGQRHLEDFLASNFSDARSRQLLGEAFGSGKLVREYDALLGRFGYSSTNLADVTAAYLVVAWEVVNGRDSNAEPQGQRAVRRQLAPALVAAPAVVALDDAGKQALADRLMFTTMMAGSAYQTLRQEGREAELERLRARLRQNVQASGVDLRDLALTPAGLVPR